MNLADELLPWFQIGGTVFTAVAGQFGIAGGVLCGDVGVFQFTERVTDTDV